MTTPSNIKDIDDCEIIKTDKFEARKSDIIDILTGNIPALGVLLRIIDIQPNETIPTAAVTNTGAPVIYYNPNFVNEHCETKVHMAMLLLHEIYHVLLGHTLNKKITKTDNIIADAIINAMICMQYPSYGFQSFFMNLYNENNMPEALLRPKSRLPRFWQRQKYKQLYTVMGLAWEDIAEILRTEKKEKLENTILLGNHNNQSDGEVLPDVILDNIAGDILEEIEKEVLEQQQKELDNLLRKGWYLKGKVRTGHFGHATEKEKLQGKRAEEMLSKIEDEIDAIKNAGTGASIFVKLLKKRVTIAARKKELEEELRKVAQQNLYSKLETKLKGMFPKIPETSVVPNYRNRRAIVSLVSGQYTPFFKNPLRPKDFGSVTIYIDVSGSMDGFISTIYKLACNCKDYLDEKIYLFSNDVREITKDELLKGVIKTTGGTDDVFLTHALDKKKRKLIVFTDGYLSVSKTNIDAVRSTGTKIIAAYRPNHLKLPKEILLSELVMNEHGEAKKVTKRDINEEDDN